MKGLQILSNRPAHEWMSRVNQKQHELESIRLSPDQKEKLALWTTNEFINSTLRLEGASLPGTDPALADIFEALRIIDALIESNGSGVTLTPELLLKINRPSGGPSSEFRMTPGSARLLKPPPPGHVRASVESACRWFTAESFVELHPAEQAAIVNLRLNEIQPFEGSSERIALIASSLFTKRRSLPPIIIAEDHIPAYRAALDEGLRMNTGPMVELIGQCVEKTLTGMLGLVTRR